MKKDILKIDNIKLNSRLIVGTGKYKNFGNIEQKNSSEHGYSSCNIEQMY